MRVLDMMLMMIGCNGCDLFRVKLPSRLALSYARRHVPGFSLLLVIGFFVEAGRGWEALYSSVHVKTQIKAKKYSFILGCHGSFIYVKTKGELDQKSGTDIQLYHRYMECNKDEAIKAVEIVERKFLERDFTGAKRFVLKAQNLYPGLDGIPQMMATLDVYIHSENKVCGEADWYGILGANPWDNEETIRKQYRKLALMLHPDKNKSIGAEGAFKLVSEAWNLLSVQSQRYTYNQKRNARVVQPATQSSSTYPSGPSPGNDIHFPESKRSNAKARSRHVKIATASDPGPHKDGTFWTMCSKCRTHYEYQRQYLNHNLLCPSCSQVFVAIEKAPPKHIFNSSRGTSARGVVSASATAQGVVSTSSTAQGELNQVSRERNCIKREMMNFAFEEETPMKRTKVGNHSNHVTGGNVENTNGTGRPVLSSVERALVFLRKDNLLMKKARAEIQKKLLEWTSDATVGKKGVQVKGREATSELLTRDDKLRPGVSGANVGENVALFIDVPDSDFHNFDLDRSEGSFNVDQVWASYDDTDGMPRFYARIHKVISVDPFKIKLSWLDSENDDEFGYSVWIDSGFYKTCGDFKAGKPESCNKLNGFSHKVVWSESALGIGTTRIVPRKGETWALYRNWSLEWNADTPDDVVHLYEIMEVVDDYNEERGILVSPLVKVAGFRSVFRPCEDRNKVKSIPKGEMPRFSHQVPSHLLTGEEAHNVRRGFRELDPAALPEELLREVKDKKGDADNSNWADEAVQEVEGEEANAEDNGRADQALGPIPHMVSKVK